MALSDAIKYLEENKSKLSRDALISNLKKSGYPEEEIIAATKKVYLNIVSEPATSGGKTFIDGKVPGFITGFIVSWILSAVLGYLFYWFLYDSYGYGSLANSIFYNFGQFLFRVAVLVLLYFYLKKKHQYFWYGFLTQVLLSLVFDAGLSWIGRLFWGLGRY